MRAVFILFIVCLGSFQIAAADEHDFPAGAATKRPGRSQAAVAQAQELPAATLPQKPLSEFKDCGKGKKFPVRKDGSRYYAMWVVGTDAEFRAGVPNEAGATCQLMVGSPNLTVEGLVIPYKQVKGRSTATVFSGEEIGEELPGKYFIDPTSDPTLPPRFLPAPCDVQKGSVAGVGFNMVKPFEKGPAGVSPSKTVAEDFERVEP